MAVEGIKRGGDAVAVYYEESSSRAQLIEASRRSMEAIILRLEDRRRGHDHRHDGQPLDIESALESEAWRRASVSEDDTDHDDKESESFALWLRSISQCLSNKISDDPVVLPQDDEQDSDGEDLDDEEHCMRLVVMVPGNICKLCFRVVLSVFDEETATEVIKSYLTILRDAVLPEEARINFKKVHFESDSGSSIIYIHIYLITGIAEIFSGFYMVQSFLNCYMLSRNKRLMCKLSINLKYLCIIYI